MCIKNIQFQSDGQKYKQVEGVAMESPLGPIFANLFMSHWQQD